jgi:uncharacterized RDD family membrane protein YckC
MLVEKHRYAGLVWRGFAFYLDLWILSGIGFLLRHAGDHYPAWINHVWSDYSLLFVLAYFVLFEASPMQATPGKRCCDFIVAASDGERLPWWRVLLRNILRPISILLCFAGLVTCVFDRRRRMLHDMLTGSAHFAIPLEEREGPRRPVWH